MNSSNVGGIANETSWTSWALTSLSSNIGKLTTKPQQPSVNLTLAKSDSQTALSNTSTTIVPSKGWFRENFSACESLNTGKINLLSEKMQS